MKLIETNITETFEELYLIETLNLNNKRILELGCGAALMTKKIAENGINRELIACEVDEIQHKENLELDIDNIKFILCGAEDIPLEDNSIDIIFMFKSFHHIPKDLMPQALNEIYRVLKPNALAYISEPLFYGEQNKLIAMFHDEEEVRINAFNNVKESVDKGLFKLFKEIFFQTKIFYKDFQDFKNKQMNLTYNNNKISEELENKIKNKFNSYNQGQSIELLKAFRVDILQKY